MQYTRINPADNVAVALSDLSAGSSVEGIVLSTDVPRGHKVLLRDLKAGENVIKYGFPIGHVTRDVAAGTVVDHTCIKTNLEGLLEYKYEPSFDTPESDKTFCGIFQPQKVLVREGQKTADQKTVDQNPVTFKGFRRADGQVGIRNQIWVIPTVGCVNGICQTIVERFKEEIAGQAGNEEVYQAPHDEVRHARPDRASTVDAIVAFPHNYGCSQLGDDHENTRRVLADMVHHPNAGGVLVVSLGCENNQLEAFKELVGPVDENRVKMFVTQKVGDEIEYGLRQLRDIYAVCSKDEREDVPVSELCVGLKCGGSDGLSGITANPLLGVFSDWIVSQGGTTVLTEVPEMFGAETILMNRCQDRATFDKTVSLINDFKEYFMKQGQPVYENPSPGNKAGGISTLEEKSLGCTQKCGKSLVRGVLKYGERLSVKGLNLLSAPGNDLVASTALGASGCQIVLFTTGRGTPFGSFVPTMKISTNTPLALGKAGWIDFNAGVLAEGEPMESVAARFIDTVLAVASGAPVRTETKNYREIAIFKSGVTL
ncbi:MAG: altronate dehydratase [Bacteroidales bacterium]|nr:altronate dehydratase [Bacteroidales bacterium]